MAKMNESEKKHLFEIATFVLQLPEKARRGLLITLDEIVDNRENLASERVFLLRRALRRSNED